MSSPKPVHQGSVRGSLHRPQASGTLEGVGLVLTHGAGANCESDLLRTVASAFAAGGATVLRCDLPFRQNRPSGPPRPADAGTDQAGLRDALSFLRPLVSGALYLGGHSYGGRQGSMLLAGDPPVADGLLLLSYPLHPPEKPQQLRTAHWPALLKPALFVHGSKDSFGSPDEVRQAMAAIPSRTELVVIQGAGHDLKRGRFDLAGALLVPFAGLMRPGAA